MQIAPCIQGMNIKFEIFIATFHGRIQIAVKTRRQLTGSMRRRLGRTGEQAIRLSAGRADDWQADKQTAKQSSKCKQRERQQEAQRLAEAPCEYTNTHTQNILIHLSMQSGDMLAQPRRGTLLLHIVCLPDRIYSEILMQ